MSAALTPAQAPQSKTYLNSMNVNWDNANATNQIRNHTRTNNKKSIIIRLCNSIRCNSDIKWLYDSSGVRGGPNSQKPELMVMARSQFVRIFLNSVSLTYAQLCLQPGNNKGTKSEQKIHLQWILQLCANSVPKINFKNGLQLLLLFQEIHFISLRSWNEISEAIYSQ